MNGPWAQELIALRKEVEACREALDLCYHAFDQYHHSHDVGRLSERQFEEPMGKALEHPEMIAARKRKQRKFLRHLERAAAEVASWPDWKRGV